MSEPAHRHLVLVGLMGAGKTTIGEQCADRLARPFLDTDDLVTATTGRTIPEIFAGEGEATFRALEQQAVADASASPQPLVIACGGGAVLDPENRRHLRATGLVVWLRASPAVLAERLEHDSADRPLVPLVGARDELTRLAEARAPAYEAAAHVAVETDGRSVTQVVDAVLEELSRCAA